MADEKLSFDLLIGKNEAAPGFSATGRAAAAASDDVLGLAKRLDEVGKKSAKAKVGLEGDKDADLQLDKLNLKLLKLGRTVARPDISVDGFLKASIEIKAVELELDKLNRKADDISARGSGLSKLEAALGGLFAGGGSGGGAGAGGLPVIGALSDALPVLVAASPLIGAVLVEAVGLASGLAAAGAGVAAFGLLALPTFKAIATAYTGITAAHQKYTDALAKEKQDPTTANAAAVKKALDALKVAQDNLSPSTKTAVGGIQNLDSEYHKMATAFAPDALKVFNDALGIANTLLPDVKPFADTASTAIDGLLKHVGVFFKSADFKTWLASFEKIAGPAIGAIGKGIGQVSVSAGKLLTVMSAKDVVHAITIAFDIISGALTATRYVVERLMGAWDDMSGDISAATANAKLHGAQMVHFFTVDVIAGLKLFRDEEEAIWERSEVDILEFVATVTRIMGKLPGPLGAPFRAAHKAIEGELDGIEAAAARTAGRINADWARIHGTANITVHADGTFKVGNGLVGLAAGGRIPGFGGGDKHLRLLEGGEAVVDKDTTRRNAGVLRMMGVPGMAAGGVVGSYSGAVPGLGPWMGTESQAALRALESATAKAATSALKSMAAGGAKFTGKFGSGVAQWGPDVIAALQQLGLSTGLTFKVLFQMQTESGGSPNAINLTDCVTFDYVILTKRGWLSHDQVQPGDETIGYNPETGRSEWTPVTRVVRYEDAEVWRIGHKSWRADVTPNHRWWSDTLTRVQPAEETCPECGWVPRGRKAPARGVQVHRNKIHGTAAARGPVNTLRGEFVRTGDLRDGHRLRLAGPADTDGIPGLALDEARILAWLQGDGSISPFLAKPVTCPECGWLPGTGRKAHQGPVVQPATGVAVHRAKKHGMGKDRSTGEMAGYDGRIWQSKPAQIVKLRALLATIEHTETVRSRDGKLPAHCFILRRAYVTDLIKRSKVMETGPEALVLALSPDQRAAWLDSMIDAEGHRQQSGIPASGASRGADGEFVRIAQVDGPLQDAIKLAVYLEGYRPTYSRLTRQSDLHQPAGHVGMARPHVAPSMFAPPEVLERQPVWCVTTELGTWTTRGGDALPFLTGNSNAAAGDPSRGLLAHAGDRLDLRCLRGPVPQPVNL